MRSWVLGVTVAVALSWSMSGCPEADAPVPPEPYTPPPRALDAGAFTGLHRLTDAEWRNAAEDLTGVRWEGDLPQDLVLHGYSSVGAAETTVAPLDFELYEAAAWAVAEAAVPDADARDAIVGCDATPLLGLEDELLDSAACIRTFAAGLLEQAWRRPASGEEADAYVALYDDVVAQTGRSVLAVQAVLAAAMAAPDFLFRVELGRERDGDPTRRWLTDHEMWARLRLTIQDQPGFGEIDASDEAAVAEAALSLWMAAQSGDAAVRFLGEWWDLEGIWLTSKDPTMFPQWNDALKAGLVAEAESMFLDLVDADGDVRDLLTTTEAWVTPEVAALYGVSAPADGLTLVELPADRAGLLGRGAFLAPNAHATLTSPTLRGKFVRARLLCQDIPPPPEGVIASLDGVDDTGTLRQQLEQHMEDDACRPCHEQMDPIGFAFEHFDPAGAWRDTDRGHPVDAASDIDGTPVEGAADVGAVVAAHGRLPGCVTINAWSHLLGHIEQHDEDDSIDAVAGRFEAGGYRLSELHVAVAETIDFRSLRAPDGGECTLDEEGATRACATDCGDGTETCRGGVWTACTATRPAREACNGVDDDCDGLVDEEVIASCEPEGGGAGLRTCSEGAWSDCASPNVARETCNGVDDDGDGLVDEELAVDFRSVTSEQLASRHPSCQPALTSSWTDNCRSAVHRECAAVGCGPTGIGPIAMAGSSAYGTIACLSSDEAVVLETSFTALAAHHEWCTQGNAFSRDCNAAIHRWCSASGLVTGYGPIEHSGDLAIVACKPGATPYGTTYTEMSAFHPTCNGGAQRSGEECDEAYHRFCRANGHRTGHGPLENSGDVVWVACIGSLE